MNIKFIEWLCDKAKKFNFKIGQITDPANFMYTLYDLNPEYKKDMWELSVYPFLLQKAIEGVNRDNELPDITQMKGGISVTVKTGYFITYHFDLGQSEDKCKELALKYVYKGRK